MATRGSALWALAVAAALLASVSALPSHFDEEYMLKHGTEAPKEMKEVHMRKLREYTEGLAAKIKAVPESETHRRGRRMPTVDASHTTCSACVGAGKWWNGIACVEAATYESAFMIIGCFWGTGHATDCSEQCFTPVTVDAGCGEFGDTGACVAGSSDGMASTALKIGMLPTVGASIGITGPATTGTVPGYFFYDQYLGSVSAWFDLFELRLSGFQLANGATTIADGPPAVNAMLNYAVMGRGTYSSFSSGGGGFSMLVAYVMLDAYYMYDMSTCANGVTGSSGACGGEALLTSSNVYPFSPGAGFDFRVNGPQVNTSVAVGSDTMLSNYTFCSTPTASSNKFSEACLSITVLYLPVQTMFDFSGGLTSNPPASSGTYSCGSYSETVDVFAYKIDTYFNGINYDGNANRRIGVRLLATTQTGSVSFAASSTTSSVQTTFTNGPLELVLNKDVKTATSSAATCGSTQETDVVKAASINSIATSGSTTNCGHSSWFTPAAEAYLAGEGFAQITCNFGSFSTASQPSYILWDPTVKQNQANADAAFESKNSGGGSSSGLGTGAIIGIAVAAVVVIAVVAFVVVKSMRGGGGSGGGGASKTTNPAHGF